MPKLEIKPIGVIHTQYNDLEGMPIQPSGGTEGTIEIFDEYIEGLKDLDGFSHIILLYHLHRSTDFKLSVVPFMDNKPHGLFATRAPNRPNPIGLSIVILDRIEDNVLHIQNTDVLDGTPLLDIKPYVARFDQQSNVRSGWLDETEKSVAEYRSDNRFNKK